VTWSDDAAGKRLHLSRSAKLGPHPSTRSHTSCRPFFAPDNKHHAKFPRHLAFLHHETPLHLPSLTGNSHHLTLKMSAPSLDPPKAATYTIHPNKQCGVVKEDGNPCSTRLGCRIHSEGEKLVVKRSRRHQKFLRKQLAFDPLRLAPVFDPDVHCGVDLSSGEPCTQDLLCCDTDTTNEQAAVPGRCASLNSIIRVNKANASRPQWKSGDDPWQYDSDTDCGARTKNGGRCQGLLSCTLHKLRAKRSAPRKSSYDFNTLLQIQISRRALYGEDEPSRHDAAEKGQDGQVDHILGGSGEGQQTSGGEGSTGSDGIYAQGGIQDGPPATPGRPPR
jgi:hypothetical protein